MWENKTNKKVIESKSKVQTNSLYLGTAHIKFSRTPFLKNNWMYATSYGCSADIVIVSWRRSLGEDKYAKYNCVKRLVVKSIAVKIVQNRFLYFFFTNILINNALHTTGASARYRLRIMYTRGKDEAGGRETVYSKLDTRSFEDNWF